MAMKNPWMRYWLSAANRAAGIAMGMWAAEMQRQQRLFAKEMAKAWGLAAAAPRREPEPQSRAK
jgi:hypothetical protein